MAETARSDTVAFAVLKDQRVKEENLQSTEKCNLFKASRKPPVRESVAN